LNHLSLLRMLSVSAAGFAAIMLLCGLAALAAGEAREAIGFAGTSVPIAILSMTILLLTDPPTRPSRAREGLGFAILLWPLFGLLGSLPIFVSVPGVSLTDSLYESLSNLTTTGHSLIFASDQPLSVSMLIWRAALHLTGTLMSLVIAASVFAAINLGGPGVHRTRFYAETERSFFEILPELIRISAALTLGASLVLGAVLLVCGVPPREALAGAVSAVSTGLVDPSAYRVAPSQGILHSLILAAGLFVGTFGLLLLDPGRGRNVPQRLIDPEVQIWILLVLLIAGLALLAGLPLMRSLSWSGSALSTSGMALSETTSHHRLPLPLLLLPALIGGSALSAAGGVKLARLFVLIRRAGLEFVQLGYRGSIQHFTYRGLRQSEKTVMGVWVYMVGYCVAFGLGALFFSLSGLMFEDAVRAATGSLSNAGYLLFVLPDEFSQMSKFLAIGGMLLGRLEVIALLPAISSGFWQK